MTTKREKERARTKALWAQSAHALTYARCPNGHQRVVVKAVVTKTSRHLEVWCNEVGCTAKEVIHPQERVI